MTDPATAGWIVLALELVFTLALIVLACGLTYDDEPA